MQQRTFVPKSNNSGALVLLTGDKGISQQLGQQSLSRHTLL